MGTFDYLGMLK